MEPAPISQSKKNANEFRSSTALELEKQRFFYKNEDIELLSYTKSQVGFGDMKLFSSSKYGKEQILDSSIKIAKTNAN